MPSSLAHFPREILAKITSHLSSLDILLRLYGCGDSTLTNKLKTRGVTSLRYGAPLLPQSRIDFIQSLQLDFFAIDAQNLPLTIVRQLSQGMCSSLKRIHLDLGPRATEKQEYFFAHSSTGNGGLQPLSVPVRPYSATVWIVRNTYPQLESLWLSSGPNEVWVTVEFLAGLPDTLVDFSLEESDIAGLNTVALLPPHISSVRIQDSLPSMARFTNITSMELIIPLSSARAAAQRRSFSLVSRSLGPGLDLGHWRKKSLSEVEPKSWSFPPSLAKLLVDCPAAYLLESLPAFPSQLTSLRIDSSDEALVFANPLQLFGLVPRSVVKLTIGATLNFLSPDQHGGVFTLPNVKQLHISLNDQVSADLCRQVLLLMPQVDDLYIKCASYMLTLDRLNDFNCALLRKIYSCFDMECFVKRADGTYPLATMLPNLHTLIVDSSGLPAKTFDFGAIPPSVTVFASFLAGHTTETLHLIPPRIKSFRMLLGADILFRAENFDQLFRSQSPSTKSITVEDPVGKNCRLTLPRYAYLSRSDDGKIICSEVQSEGCLGQFVCNWPVYIPLEMLEGCCDLYIGHSRFALQTVPSPSFVFSSLAKLHIDSNRETGTESWSLDSLTDLNTNHYFGQRYPPNLTRLTVGETLVPEIIPLPPKLTYLECSTATPSTISSLSLQTFVFLGTTTKSTFLDWRGAFPTTLTELRIPWQCLSHKDQQCWTRQELSIHLFDRLPRLNRLALLLKVPYALVEAMYDVSPTHVDVEIGFVDERTNANLSVIARQAKLSHGDLDVFPCEPLSQCIERVVQRAYSRFKLKRTFGLGHQKPVKHFDETSLTNAMWTSFCPFLAHSVTRLCVYNFCIVFDAGGNVTLPPALTTLICDELGNLPLLPVKLPLQLEHLSLKNLLSVKLKMEVSHSLEIPPGMRHLDIPLLVFSDLSYTWPNLTHLRISCPLEAISKLPTTLEHLCLVNPGLEQSYFASLPKALKRFSGYIVRHDRDAFLEHARKVGLTWIIAPKPMEMLLTGINFESSLDALSGPRLTP